MKKFILLIMSLLAVSVLLMGCGNDESADSGDEIVVDFMTFSVTPEQEETLQEMIAIFEEENPGITINYEIVPFADYFTKLQTDLAAGTAADCFELNYENSVTYYENGAIADLTPFIEESELDLSQYDSSCLNAFNVDGEQFALPHSFSTVVVYYNKDLFDQAGIPYPTADWTWEDEIAAAQAIEDLGEEYTGMVVPFTYNELYKTAAQNGGSLFDEEGNPTINSAENEEALQYMSDLIYEYEVTPQNLESDQDTQMFMSGTTGMITTGSWMIPTFYEAPFEWDMVVEPGNSEKATHFFTNSLAINASSSTEEQEAAFKWMTFYTTDERVLEMKIENNWEIPATSNQEIIDMYIAQGQGENRQVVFDSLAYGVNPPTPSGINATELQDTINITLDEVKLGTLSVEEAIKKMQSDVEELKE